MTKKEFNKTYKDVVDTLNKNGICNIERPTAFGKTTLLIHYAKQHKHEHICFVEFSRAKIKELEDENRELKNVEYITYNAISRDPKEFIKRVKNKEFNIIFFDESHRCGAKKIRESWEEFKKACYENNVKILGCTGTSFRTTDGIDVTKRMFMGIRPYKYDINDAYNDRYVFLPEYYSCRGNYSNEEKDKLKKKLKDAGDIRLIEQVSNLGHIIKDVIDSENMINTYYKFILYYTSIKEINENIENVKEQLKNEFKGFSINVIPITSDSSHIGNISVINSLQKRQKTIDVLMTVNMMNEGFHLKDLTGIVLIRRTSSALVYTQQIGRCITINKDHKMVVIDIAGNIDTKFTVQHPFKEIYKNKSRKSEFSNETRDIFCLEVKMTPEQRKLSSILNKLSEIKETVFIVTINNFKRMYNELKYRGDNLVHTAMQYGIDGFTTPEEIYTKVENIWLDEDKLDNVPVEYIETYNNPYLAWEAWYSARHIG